ncbi:Tpa, partial [Temnothorax longispinosus]
MLKVDNLLKRLSIGLPNMPKIHKTLLKSNFNLEISNLESGGKMWYKGFTVNLDQMLLQDYLRTHGKIIIDINIDGLPLFNSSKLKFWSILGHLVGTLNEPFIIAVYCGKSDPQNIEEYLEKYVSELEDLFHNGYEYEGNNYEVVIRNYVLDAPARAFIKCCKGHSGYAGCEKCTVIGKYHNHRITF